MTTSTNSRLKLVSLIAFTLQTSIFVLIVRRSRQPDENGTVYSAGTAVLLTEVTKLIISFVVVIARTWKGHDNAGYLALPASPPNSPSLSVFSRRRQLFQDVKSLLWTPSAFWLAVPAASYVVQNNCQILAASYLEPALFQTCTQAKLITTAGFSVLLMKRSLYKLQWLSIFLLAVGLATVHQMAGTQDNTAKAAASSFDAHKVTLGFILMMIAALLSGFAGVFTEKMLKQDKDFWATNVHMSAFSILPASLVIVFQCVQDRNFYVMQAFGFWAWVTVLFSAFGGLVISMVLKYADSIAKGFSAALSVILVTFINVVFFRTLFTFSCLFGIMIVLLSTTMYIAAGAMNMQERLRTPRSVEDAGDAEMDAIGDSSQSSSSEADEKQLFIR